MQRNGKMSLEIILLFAGWQLHDSSNERIYALKKIQSVCSYYGIVLTTVHFNTPMYVCTYLYALNM